MKHSFVATTIVAAILASSAWAQTPAEAPTGTPATQSVTERSGFVFSFGVGLGIGHRTAFDCDYCWGEHESSTGIRLMPPPQLQLGFMASPKVAILLSFYTGVYFPPNDADMRTFDFVGPTVQLFLNDKTWVKGGVGLGMDTETVTENIDNIDTGVGLVVAAGTALMQKKKYSLDLEGRVLFASIGRDVSTFNYNTGYSDSSVSQKFTAFEVAITFTHW